MVGVGFYGAAILLSVISAGLMMWGGKLEGRLPSRRAMGVSMTFSPEVEPSEVTLKDTIRQWGYAVAEGSLNISSTRNAVTWHFVMVALKSHPNPSSLFELSRHLRKLSGVDTLQITHARN
jgi:putative Mg2+ transporter-C (MgtC) family protein